MIMHYYFLHYSLLILKNNDNALSLFFFSNANQYPGIGLKIRLDIQNTVAFFIRFFCNRFLSYLIFK